MSVFRVFFCADSSNHLGRLDYASLTQQTLMEMLVDGIEKWKASWKNEHVPSDVDQWEGVKTNTSKEVISVCWNNSRLTGTISFEWLPSTVEEVSISFNKLRGTLDLQNIPRKLRVFGANNNRLRGPLNLSSLPEELETLMLRQNFFSGEVSLTHLPGSLKVLAVNSNYLTGTLDLTRLPVRLEELYVANNDFVGWTDFSQLPSSLSTLDISWLESISGEIRLPSGSTQGKLRMIIYTTGSKNIVTQHE